MNAYIDQSDTEILILLGNKSFYGSVSKTKTITINQYSWTVSGTWNKINTLKQIFLQDATNIIEQNSGNHLNAHSLKAQYENEKL